MIELAPALIGAGASLLGGVMSNEASKSSAQEQMRFQAQQTADQMAFQERMSNTAHQREVADLRAAGLNPILSVNRSGASSPVGSSAQGASYTAQNPAAGAASSALQAMSISDVLAGIKVKDAEAELLAAQTLTERNRPENVLADTLLKGKSYYLTEEQTRKVTEEINNLGKEGLNLDQQWLKLSAETKKIINEYIHKIPAEVESLRGSAAASHAMAGLTGYSAQSAAIKAALDNKLSEIERIAGITETGTSALSNMVPGLRLFKSPQKKRFEK